MILIFKKHRMKKIFTLAVLCFLNLSTQAQFTDNGTNTTTTDSLGIGVTAPAATLDVLGNIKLSGSTIAENLVLK